MTERPQPTADPKGQLEQALIDEFLQTRGYDLATVEALPADERHRLLREASIYAGDRLTEIEARAHFIDELHGRA